MNAYPITLLDSRQLGFLEVTTDIERIAVDQRQQCAAGLCIVTLAGQQVGHVTAHWRFNAGALQVQFGLGQRGNCQLHIGFGQPEVGLIAQQIRLGNRHVGTGLLPFFTGNREALFQRAPPALLALTLFEQRLTGDDCRLRLPQRGLGHFHRTPGVLDRQLIARRIDLQQQLALVDMLVVLHCQFDDSPRNIRRQRHHIRPHPSIPCPRRAGVILPGEPAEDDRQDHHCHGHHSCN